MTRPLHSEEFYLPASRPGESIYLRNRFPQGPRRFAAERVVLFIHGATFPSTAMFDVALPGGSWLNRLAAAGYDVYLLDLHGYGRASRPAAMAEEPAANPPFCHTTDAEGDVANAVAFIRARRQVAHVNLVGWSWGTTLAAGFAARQAEQVGRLVLLGPLWKIKGNAPVSGSGAYRLATREGTRQRSLHGIPAEQAEHISPASWFDRWWASAQASDPDGGRRNDPGVRAPNGVTADIADIWAQGRATYDPAGIRAPTLLLVGEWDQDTPPGMAEELFAALDNAVSKRLQVVPQATHWLAIERQRTVLMKSVAAFLQE